MNQMQDATQKEDDRNEANKNLFQKESVSEKIFLRFWWISRL